MLTYQVKITIDYSVEFEWLEWMKTKHVPDVIATGLVRSFQILKPINSEALYFFHYHFASEADFETYQFEFAQALKEHPQKKFTDLFTAEREVFQWI